MGMITQQEVLNGKIIAEQDRIASQTASIISQLKTQTDLILEMCAYLFSGNASADHIAAVTVKFQAQMPTLLGDILPKLQAIEACGNATDGEANLAAMLNTYNINPAVFTDRYK
tara:strand:+ start:320 stop:661 length:342 start_codon:yes stop_codon:yes gene_type:complete